MKSAENDKAKNLLDGLVRSILPVILALLVAGLIMLAMGSNPIDFFSGVWTYGVTGSNLQRSLVLSAPLILVAVGLIVAFRGQLWNLGYNGQYLLGAVVASGAGPYLFASMPAWLATIVIILGALLVGAVWSLVPAILKARYGTNEIITSLVMSFIGVGIANLLIKGPLKDPNTPQPQTEVIADSYLLPYIPGTVIHIGLIIAIVIAIVAQFIFSRTSFGLRLDIFGASPKAARHVGINSTWMVILLFAVSSALIALAGAIDVLGQYSYQRANWDPHYGDAVMPFVFLARLSPLAAIPLVVFYAILATGGTLAAQQAGLNADFLLVIVGLILIFMTITEYVGDRRKLGQSYLPPGLKTTVVRLFQGGTGRKSS
ncbi:ABC transporter permease [Salinibacterium sp. NG253]|uniref:putative B6 ABC transporter permease subunit 2 n=1 Tax=Salinibacterium sp. NG253 TaxID=2792039 RepID=UPI0018CC9074|nr:ABC transporter permease [Salinibacterium sp. NG253]MBH0115908.1 ABC transporter permease [Salinibacterium sp. NG253]